MAKKYVVLADIESVRVPYLSFEKAMQELSKYGEVVTCKFYGFSAKRTKDYKPFITENYYDALPTLKHKRKGKLDLRQVIDAVNIADTSQVNGFFLMYGQGDIQPLISWLKAAGYEVIAGVVTPDKNSELCTAVINLDTNVVSSNAAYKVVRDDEPKRRPTPVRKPAPAANTSEEDDLINELTNIING